MRTVPDPESPFRAPWEAQAFALTVKLHERGVFTWNEWTAALTAEIRRGGPDDGTRYYEFWLAALEGLVRAKGLASADELEHRAHEWDEAARATPHGKPIELKR